jgi:hypothetical protein
MSLVMNKVPGANALSNVKGNMSERVIASAWRPGGVEKPGMCGRSLCGNREISSLAVALCVSAGLAVVVLLAP